MNISYNWLRALAPGITGSPQQLAAQLAMYGAPVDELVALGEPLRDVVIARVLAAERHPNSDHLSLCQVDAGGAQTLSVVCGAPNVRADRFYPFAPVGAQLPNGIRIERRKIRGQESQGMLCSARELELGRDHEGIMELQGTFTPGESFINALGLDDFRIVVDVTPNRPDLLSHYGVARELAAGGEAGLALPAFPDPAADTALRVEQVSNDGAIGGITIRIENGAACPRYMAAVVRGVSIGPSPEWLAARLRAVGQRPINNVVDATNYVLQELGQPLHAFDLHALRASRIVVRNARQGEKLTTLDGVERSLTESMLAIADGQAATAIAGVMGGSESEVSAATTDVLVECAHFERKQIRATRRALGMSTDASYRFERGVDPTGMERALRRVVELIHATAGGVADPVLLDVQPEPFPERTLSVRTKRVQQVLGEPFGTADIAALLEPIGFGPAGAQSGSIDLRVPGHRWFDVTEEIDIVEEIARRHGYNSFPADLRPFRPSQVPDHPLSKLEDRLRTRLAGAGLLEARTAGFASEAEGDVRLLLPLSSAESTLRRALLPGLVHRAEYNFTRSNWDVRLFEIGTAFAPLGADEAPAETTRLALVLSGARSPVHWSAAPAGFDIWDVKGMAEELGESFGFLVRPGLGADIPGVSALLEPNSAFELVRGAAVIGQAGQIRATAVDTGQRASAVFGLELVLSEALERADRKFDALPVQPSMDLDLALLVPESVAAEAVERVMRAAAGPALERVAPFDLYRGEKIPQGTRSIAYQLRFRAADRTLTDADTKTWVGRILKRLKDDLGVERRG